MTPRDYVAHCVTQKLKAAERFNTTKAEADFKAERRAADTLRQAVEAARRGGLNVDDLLVNGDR